GRARGHGLASGLARQAPCPPAGHRDRLRPRPPGRLCQIDLRHRQRTGSRLELRPPRNDVPRSSHPVITLAGILLPSSVLHSGWFQALAAFVAVNTLIYAALSLAKLIPRKRA